MKTFAQPLVFIISLVLCAGVLPFVSYAQPKELSWPQTFNGQPDFDLEKSELMKELEQQGPQSRLKFTTLELLLKERVEDPLGSKNKKVIKSADGEETSLEPLDRSTLEALFGWNYVTEDPSGNPLAEPQIQSGTDLFNLDEFGSYLEKVIQQQFQNSKKNLATHNFTPDLDRLLLQAIVTSPQKYITLNNHRYTEGDRFILPIHLKQDEEWLNKVLNPHLPDPATVPPEIYKRYADIKATVIEDVLTRQKLKLAGESLHKVSVTIRRIEHRAAVLSILGKEYKLKLRMVF